MGKIASRRSLRLAQKDATTSGGITKLRVKTRAKAVLEHAASQGTSSAGGCPFKRMFDQLGGSTNFADFFTATLNPEQQAAADLIRKNGFEAVEYEASLELQKRLAAGDQTHSVADLQDRGVHTKGTGRRGVFLAAPLDPNSFEGRFVRSLTGGKDACYLIARVSDGKPKVKGKLPPDGSNTTAGMAWSVYRKDGQPNVLTALTGPDFANPHVGHYSLMTNGISKSGNPLKGFFSLDPLVFHPIYFAGLLQGVLGRMPNRLDEEAYFSQVVYQATPEVEFDGVANPRYIQFKFKSVTPEGGATSRDGSPIKTYELQIREVKPGRSYFGFGPVDPATIEPVTEWKTIGSSIIVDEEVNSEVIEKAAFDINHNSCLEIRGTIGLTRSPMYTEGIERRGGTIPEEEDPQEFMAAFGIDNPYVG